MMASRQEMPLRASVRMTMVTAMIVVIMQESTEMAAKRKETMIFHITKMRVVLLAKEAILKCERIDLIKMSAEDPQDQKETTTADQDLTTKAIVTETMKAEIDNLTPIVEISTPTLSLKFMFPDSKEGLANLMSNKPSKSLVESERSP